VLSTFIFTTAQTTSTQTVNYIRTLRKNLEVCLTQLLVWVSTGGMSGFKLDISRDGFSWLWTRAHQRPCATWGQYLISGADGANNILFTASSTSIPQIKTTQPLALPVENTARTSSASSLFQSNTQTSSNGLQPVEYMYGVIRRITHTAMTHPIPYLVPIGRHNAIIDLRYAFGNEATHPGEPPRRPIYNRSKLDFDPIDPNSYTKARLGDLQPPPNTPEVSQTLYYLNPAFNKT
jgi:hypothetical protein